MSHKIMKRRRKAFGHYVMASGMLTGATRPERRRPLAAAIIASQRKRK